MSTTSGAGNSGNNVDEIRYRSYLTQIERQQEADIKDKEERHKDQISKLVNTHDDQKNQLRHDYDVKISEEAEALEKKLAAIRERNAGLVQAEKDAGETEAEKVRTQYQQKIDQEKRNGDEQVTHLQQYYKKASEELAKQFDRDKMRNTQKGRNA